MPVDQKLLEILACPKCKGELQINKESEGLICQACALLYPVENDIPVMIIEEATPYKANKTTE